MNGVPQALEKRARGTASMGRTSGGRTRPMRFATRLPVYSMDLYVRLGFVRRREELCF